MTQLGSRLVFLCAHLIKLLLCHCLWMSTKVLILPFFHLNINVRYKWIFLRVLRSKSSRRPTIGLLPLVMQINQTSDINLSSLEKNVGHIALLWKKQTKPMVHIQNLCDRGNYSSCLAFNLAEPTQQRPLKTHTGRTVNESARHCYKM